MTSGWLGTGPKVARFEAQFADYKGLARQQVAALNSCTAALHLSLLALDLEPGDEVVTTPLTFCATVNTILHAGLKPVLADIDPETLNVSPDAIEQTLSVRTRALLPVHYAGRPCAMDRLDNLKTRHDLLMIEDCAHAIETRFQGQAAGTFGEFGCFSFYVTKNVACGEGGMVIGQDTAMIDRIRTLSLHGMNKDAWDRFGHTGFKHYQVVECGYKYNMMDIQAAIGLHQLGRVQQNWLWRQHVWMRYQEAFADLPVVRPAEIAAGDTHAYHLYTLLIDEDTCGISRDEFLDAMTQRRIGVGVHYLSLPEHPFYQNTLNWRPEDYPHAMKVGRQTVSLPCSPKLTEADIDYVIDTVRSIILRTH